MKKIVILLTFLGCITFCEAQVGINTAIPGSNSALEINSLFSGGTRGGFRPPIITSTQRDAISTTTTDDGLIAYVIYPDGTRCLEIYNSLKLVWESIKCFDPLVIWSETLGSPSSTTNADIYSGYDNYSTSTFTISSPTKPTIKQNAPTSSTIAGASGSGYIFFNAGGYRVLTIGNINVTSHTGPLILKLLIYKGASTTSTGSEMTIEYFSAGIWYNVSVTDLPTGIGTDDTWYSRVLSTSVPNTITQIRFTTAVGCPEFRIDDIKILKP